jgi:hypothetical protein
LLATNVEFLKQTEQAVDVTVAESSLKPPKPIITGGCWGGQFELHDAGIIEERFSKAWLWAPLGLFRVGANSKLATRIEQIRKPGKLRVLTNLNA